MFRIEKESDGQTLKLRLSGRVQATHVDEIRAQLDDPHGRKVMDLSAVTLVDAEVVLFLSACESQGIELVHCPPYVREWIIRERNS